MLIFGLFVEETHLFNSLVYIDHEMAWFNDNDRSNAGRKKSSNQHSKQNYILSILNKIKSCWLDFLIGYLKTKSTSSDKHVQFIYTIQYELF